MPSSVCVGGIRTSMTASSGWCSATALSSWAASGTVATGWAPQLQAPGPFGTVVLMIEIHELTTRYGPTTAVSDLTFTVRAGTVTGFLGPNGAGKSTTMRMILGLDEPTSGSITVNRRPPRAHAAPLHEVGGMLDPGAVHPSRSAYHHLLALAQTTGIRRSRVDEVIDAVGLRSDRVRRVLRVRGRAARVRRGADAARGCLAAQLAVTGRPGTTGRPERADS